MPFSNVLEPKLLDQLYGCVVAQCNQAISAGTTAQTSITIRGSAGSGNADHTPVVGEFWLIATPGAAGSENQYTNVDVFQCSGRRGRRFDIGTTSYTRSALGHTSEIKVAEQFWFCLQLSQIGSYSTD